MSVNINIEGDGLTYAGVTNIFKASQVIAFLNSQEANAQIQTGIVTSTNALSQGQTYANKSPRDVILESNAKHNSQKILVFADYNNKTKNKDTFKPVEIRLLFKKAGFTEPKNFSRDWKEAVKAGYIYEDHVKNDEFVISDRGLTLIADHFASEEKSNSKKATNKRKSTPKVITEEVKRLDISTSFNDYPKFYDLATKANKILWILAYADAKGIPELTTADIEYLADKLRDKIPTGGFTALSEYIFKKSYITKTVEGKIKIQHDGLEYLKSLITEVKE
ncbi:MAG: hypothetical protein NTV98_02820 [Candidatus Roizmanbacteria bacterium]|nr:hypothetical protein [Candidatus Roizmanbacteria bacterium]